jgi:hypothetical protein
MRSSSSARASLRHSDVLLNETKVYRKLRKFLDTERRSPAGARRARDELASAMSTLRETGRSEPDRLPIDVAVDATPKLPDLRRRMAPTALAREIDSAENDLRHAVGRLKDLTAVAVSESAIAECALSATSQGLAGVTYETVKYAQRTLIGWRVRLHKPR